MPSLTWQLTEKEALGEPRVDADIATAGRSLPQGAYTTLRSVGGTGLLRLSAHVARLEETMALLGYPWQAERARLNRQLCAAFLHLPWQGESRLRLTVDASATIGALWLSVEPLPTTDPSLYRVGVAALTMPMQRDAPQAKNSAFIAASQQARSRLGGRLNEVLMVDGEGRILEGLSSNFFAVRGGTLYTAEADVLPGVTRALVLASADRLALPVVRDPIRQQELGTLDECFICSTSRDVLPVVEIDGQPIGAGVPGPLTQQVAACFADQVRQAVEYPCTQ